MRATTPCLYADGREGNMPMYKAERKNAGDIQLSKGEETEAGEQVEGRRGWKKEG